MFFSSGAFAYGANAAYLPFIPFPVTMRATPSPITTFNTSLVASPTAGSLSLFQGSAWVNASPGLQSVTTTGFGFALSGIWAAGAWPIYGAWTANAEL